MALGVRKSCDASIVSSMRKMSLSNANSRDSREQLLETMGELEGEQQKQPIEQQQPTKQRGQAPSPAQDEEQAPARRLNQKSSIESLLKEAKQQHLNPKRTISGGSAGAGHTGAKPRSRSLIWRLDRKSSRSAQKDSSECRVT